MLAAVTMNLSHGYKLKGLSDPIIEMADETVQLFFREQYVRYVVDWFPFRTSISLWLLESWLT